MGAKSKIKSLEIFLEKYEKNLDYIVIGGGWALEIYKNRAHNPYRPHNDIDTLVLDENLKVETDSYPVPCRYFWSIDIESADWLLDFTVEKQVALNCKSYDVKVLCPEFIAVSKAFSRFGVTREKDNKDIRYIFDTFDLDKEKIYSLIEKAGLLREESSFLDMMIKKGWETEEYSRYDFNKKIFLEKFNIKKIPEHITNRVLESYDFLFSNIKKGLGTEWIKNNKKRMQEILDQEILNKTDIQEAGDYKLAIRDALVQKVENYGLAIKEALKYSKESMNEGLVDRLLDIPDTRKAITYGVAIKDALKYSKESMKEDLVDRLLDIPNPRKAKSYGLAIKDEFKHSEKDINTQQQIINNISKD